MAIQERYKSIGEIIVEQALHTAESGGTCLTSATITEDTNPERPGLWIKLRFDDLKDNRNLSPTMVNVMQR